MKAGRTPGGVFEEPCALLTLLQLLLVAWKCYKQLQVTKPAGFHLDFSVNPGHVWSLWCFQIIFLNYFVIFVRELQLSWFHVLAAMKCEGCRVCRIFSSHTLLDLGKSIWAHHFSFVPFVLYCYMEWAISLPYMLSNTLGVFCFSTCLLFIVMCLDWKSR